MKQLYKLWPCVFLLSFVFGNSPVTSQQSVIRGKTVDSGTGKAIEYSSVLNYSKHTRIYSNSAGEFNLNAQAGDTLVLYAVGYYYQKIIVDGAMLNTLEAKVFTLNQQAFEIAEVRIFGLGTYEEFKQQFIHLDRTQTKTEKLADDLAQVSHQVAREAYDKAKAEQKLNGITFMTIPILTPEEKERIVLAEIIEKEKIRDQIYLKFNPVVVKKVTGLTDDDLIIEFMVFCDFSDAYLLKVNDYDLMVSIARKFEMFNRKKQEEKSIQNRLDPGYENFYPNA